MEPSTSIKLKLKLLSCKDLRAFNFFQNLTIYALLSIDSDDPAKKPNQNQEQRTRTDAEGGCHPEWNHEMQFVIENQIEYDHLFVKFDFKHEGVLFGDKPIGEVRVPLKDLIDECRGVVRFLTYEVRSSDGKPNGLVNFSCIATVDGKVMDLDSNHVPVSPQISGYTIHNPIQYPVFEPEDFSSPKQSLYPKLELDEIYPPLNPSPANHHHYDYPPQLPPPLQASHYPPPQQDSHYPPPLQDSHYPPPPPRDSYFPPPPQQPSYLAQGACGWPPAQPQFYPSVSNHYGVVYGHQHMYYGGDMPQGMHGGES